MRTYSAIVDFQHRESKKGIETIFIVCHLSGAFGAGVASYDYRQHFQSKPTATANDSNVSSTGAHQSGCRTGFPSRPVQKLLCSMAHHLHLNQSGPKRRTVPNCSPGYQSTDYRCGATPTTFPIIPSSVSSAAQGAGIPHTKEHKNNFIYAEWIPVIVGVHEFACAVYTLVSSGFA